MKRARGFKRLLLLATILVLGAAVSPWLLQTYWSIRSSNPVRRGIQRAGELGCFSCHGELGRKGIPDPGETDHEVPSWSGGVWMMYVENDQEIREYILNGSSNHREHDTAGGHKHDELEIDMPAFKDVLSGSDLEDLVAAFKVLSGMALPPPGSSARRGLELARRWRCFSCHGHAGSGGLLNPGSYAGFIPGWYGADFDDLVRDREEFDAWVREGSIPRLEKNPLTSFFVKRQRVSMPAYKETTAGELDDLWAYVRWLKDTEGGHRGVEKP